MPTSVKNAVPNPQVAAMTSQIAIKAATIITDRRNTIPTVNGLGGPGRAKYSTSKATVVNAHRPAPIHPIHMPICVAYTHSFVMHQSRTSQVLSGTDPRIAAHILISTAQTTIVTAITLPAFLMNFKYAVWSLNMRMWVHAAEGREGLRPGIFRRMATVSNG